MSVDLKLLDKTIKLSVEKIDSELLTAVKKVAVAVDGALVLATPVDTGLARNNWLPSLNVKRNFFDATVKGSPVNVKRTKGQLLKLELGDIIYFTNNLPYIGKLNKGSSKQAAANFVQKAALTAANSLTGLRV